MAWYSKLMKSMVYLLHDTCCFFCCCCCCCCRGGRCCRRWCWYSRRMVLTVLCAKICVFWATELMPTTANLVYYVTVQVCLRSEKKTKRNQNETETKLKRNRTGTEKKKLPASTARRKKGSSPVLVCCLPRCLPPLPLAHRSLRALHHFRPARCA